MKVGGHIGGLGTSIFSVAHERTVEKVTSERKLTKMDSVRYQEQSFKNKDVFNDIPQRSQIRNEKCLLDKLQS